MLSRVADSIYWMSRYIERAENVARFVDVNLALTMDIPEETGQWEPLIAASGDDGSFRERYGEATRAKVMEYLTFDRGNPSSILSCLFAARENARSIREIISSAMWEQLNRHYLDVRETAAKDPTIADAHAFFHQVKAGSQLFVGIMDGTMSHGEAWHFAHLGRLLERADQTSRVLDVKYFYLLPESADVGSPLDDLQWSAVLRSATALEMYRKKRRRRITPWDVADFLILDAEFPRSIRFCVRAAQSSLHTITGSAVGTFANEAEKRMGRLRSELDYVDTEDLFARGLHEFLQDVQDKIAWVGTGIHETFFAAQPVAHAADAARGGGASTPTQ